MKRAWALAFLVLALGMRAQASEVVLMTSLQAPDDVLHDLETRFHEKFDSSGFDVKIIRAATQEQLREELLSSDVAGLFWVSHAANERELAPGLDAGATILDQYGDNVKNLFSETNPSLQFLAIIGCQAKGIAQEFAEKGYYGLHPTLRILAFSDDVEIHEGLNEALDTSDEYLKTPVTAQSNPTQAGLSIRISRTATVPAAAVRIDMGDAVLGFLPSENAGDTQELVGFVPENHLQTVVNSNPDLNIQITLNQGDGAPYQALGSFKMTPDSWKLFATPDGMPVGNQSELYLFSGNPAAL